MTDPNGPGVKWESLAREYLKKQGYHLIKTNFSCRRGEIDIIARKGRVLVFVEVRARFHGFFEPEESLTAKKINRLKCTAEFYLKSFPWNQDIRFDLIAVSSADSDFKGGPDQFYDAENNVLIRHLKDII
jgi:putative endonuclease